MKKTVKAAAENVIFLFFIIVVPASCVYDKISHKGVDGIIAEIGALIVFSLITMVVLATGVYGYSIAYKFAEKKGYGENFSFVFMIILVLAAFIFYISLDGSGRNPTYKNQ